MLRPEIITLGCRLNIAESETMRSFLHEDDDIVVVNSCAVTAEAVKQTRQAIRRARRDRPDARIIVTGCAAEIEPQSFADMSEVDAVIGNRAKLDPASFYPSASRSPKKISAFTQHARAFVEVQNGCDHSCTFCIIPQCRGASRSIPAAPLVDRIKALVDRGHEEIILTGVDVTSYGADLPGTPSLGHLVEQILRDVPELPRLRLSSLDSVEIDDRLFEIITGEPRLMPHLHLSLQAGDDLVLKRMKRRHSRADAVRIVDRLKSKRPAIAIGADIIAGFPTESEAMFANSLALVADCDIVHGHIFPYSPRAGTPAARMPQVDPPVVRDRAKRLREACGARHAAWLETLIGTTQDVLVELSGDKGHCGNFAMVQVPSQSAHGCMSVQIIASDGHSLTGIPS